MPTAGQIAILGQHFAGFREKLERMVRRRLDDSWKDRIEPQDVVMEAYVRGHKRWLADPSKTHIAEYWWWYRLSLDCLIEGQRHLSADRRNVNRVIGLPSHPSRFISCQLGGAITTPSNAAERRETEEKLNAAIDAQKDEYRQILWMRYFEKLSFSEIANVLDVSPNAVQKRHARAIAELAAKMQL